MLFLFKYYYELIAPLFINIPINSLTRCRFWAFRKLWDLWDKQTIFHHNNKVSNWPTMYINKYICKTNNLNNKIIQRIIKYLFFFVLPLLYPLFALIILFKLYNKNNKLSLYKTYRRIILNPDLFLFTDSLDSKSEWLKSKYDDKSIQLYMSHFITKIISTIQNSQIDDKIILNELCVKNNIPSVKILFTLNKNNYDTDIDIVKDMFVKIRNGSGGSHAYRIQYNNQTQNYTVNSYDKPNDIITNINLNKYELNMFFKNKIIQNNLEFIFQPLLKNQIGLFNVETLGVFRIKTYKYKNTYKLHCMKYYMPLKDTVTSQGNNKIIIFYENNKVSYVKNTQKDLYEDINKYSEFNNLNVEKAIELCLDAHEKIGSDCFYIGWDVIYNNGYKILEANTPCGISSIEQNIPIENTLFGQTLINHIELLNNSTNSTN